MSIDGNWAEAEWSHDALWEPDDDDNGPDLAAEAMYNATHHYDPTTGEWT